MSIRFNESSPYERYAQRNAANQLNRGEPSTGAAGRKAATDPSLPVDSFVRGPQPTGQPSPTVMLDRAKIRVTSEPDRGRLIDVLARLSSVLGLGRDATTIKAVAQMFGRALEKRGLTLDALRFLAVTPRVAQDGLHPTDRQAFAPELHVGHNPAAPFVNGALEQRTESEMRVIRAYMEHLQGRRQAGEIGDEDFERLTDENAIRAMMTQRLRDPNYGFSSSIDAVSSEARGERFFEPSSIHLGERLPSLQGGELWGAGPGGDIQYHY